jgi:hypothetical protein
MQPGVWRPLNVFMTVFCHCDGQAIANMDSPMVIREVHVQ